MKLCASLKILPILVTCSLGFLANAQNESSSYGDTLGKLFEANGSYPTFQTVIDQMFDIYKQSYSAVDTDTWNEIQAEFKKTSIQELVELLTPVYQKYLTEEDLKQIIAFYNSPIGKKLAHNTPNITSETMAVGQQWGLAIGEKVMKKLEEKGF